MKSSLNPQKNSFLWTFIEFYLYHFYKALITICLALFLTFYQTPRTKTTENLLADTKKMIFLMWPSYWDLKETIKPYGKPHWNPFILNAPGKTENKNIWETCNPLKRQFESAHLQPLDSQFIIPYLVMLIWFYYTINTVVLWQCFVN